MKLSAKTIGVTCAVCSRKIDLKGAISEEWKKCSVCGIFLCPDCINLVSETMNGYCPSTMLFSYPRHKLELENISTDEVLVFAKKIREDGLIGPLIERLFYASSHYEKQTPPSNNTSWSRSDDAITKEELWRRYGLVIVKRRRGKFIMWEKIK